MPARGIGTQRTEEPDRKVESEGAEEAQDQEKEVLKEQRVGAERWQRRKLAVWLRVGGSCFFDAGPGEVDVEEEE